MTVGEEAMGRESFDTRAAAGGEPCSIYKPLAYRGYGSKDMCCSEHQMHVAIVAAEASADISRNLLDEVGRRR